MHKFIVLFLALLQGQALLAQPELDSKRGHLWIFGYGSGPQSDFPRSYIDFNPQPAVVGTLFSAMNMSLANTSICDTAGNLSFYSNGIQAFNRQHHLMEGGSGLNEWENGVDQSSTGYRLYQGILALPFPEHEGAFFLLHEPRVWSNDIFGTRIPALLLTTVDMNQNNGLGKVTAKNQVLLEAELDYGKITATRHANGRDWWVVAPGFYSNKYYTFLLDPSGIILSEVQEAGPEIPSNVGQAVFSPDGSRYARVQAYNHRYPDTLAIFDFDRCTGTLANPLHSVKFDSSAPVGVAISPNSRYLYQSSNRFIYQYDLQAEDVPASRTLVAEYDGYASPFTTRFFMAQLAPDGKIYINTPNGTNVLHVIENPDLPGTACQVCQHCVQLPTYNALSMPNFPNYRLGPLDGSPCDTLGLDNPVAAVEPPGVTLQLKVYPNPASTHLTIEPEGPAAPDGRWQLFDPTGREVRALKIRMNASYTVPLSGLAHGVYYWRLSVKGDPAHHGKIVISQ